MTVRRQLPDDNFSRATPSFRYHQEVIEINGIKGYIELNTQNNLPENFPNSK
jgi:hypothetical protein